MEQLQIIKNWLLLNRNFQSHRKITGALALVILFVLPSPSFSQSNLVPNGDFESYSSCPPNPFGTINYAVPWFQPNYPYAGAGGSSDFDHFCSGYDCSSFMQCPRSGEGMGGIGLFHFPHLDTDEGREYLEVGLIDSLKPGKKYCLRIYVNMLDRDCFPVKQIQAVLTNDSLLYTSPNFEYIPGQMPVLEADAVVDDSINWVMLSTVHTAMGGERFLTIGCFEPGDSVIYDSICPNPLPPGSYAGYYWFDDISIYEQPDVFAGNDTLIPPGDSVQLGSSGRPDVFYSWSPSTGLSDPDIANPMATPGISTTYILTISDTNSLACSNILYDTVTVSVGYAGIGEQALSAHKGTLYPNPAQNSITFEGSLSSIEKGAVMIFGMEGKLISSNVLHPGYNKLEIDLTKFSNGIYLYKIMINGAIADYKKLVIAK
jgi:hypothetical protein